MLFKSESMSVTPSVVINNNDNTITLERSGKNLVMKIVSSDPIRLKTWSTDPTENPWTGSPNNDTSVKFDDTYTNKGKSIMVGYELYIPADATREVKVFLIPGSYQGSIDTNIASVNQW